MTEERKQLQFSECAVGENGEPIRRRNKDLIALLEKDIDILVIPEAIPSQHQIHDFMRNTQITSNNIIKVRKYVQEGFDIWDGRRERLQKTIGASNAVTGTDTKRKDMKSVATALWGPVSPRDPKNSNLGIKNDILDIEYETALQLAEVLAPGKLADAIPRVDSSFDDICLLLERNLDRIKELNDVIEARHFDINNIVRLLEMENRESRSKTNEKTLAKDGESSF